MKPKENSSWIAISQWRWNNEAGHWEGQPLQEDQSIKPPKKALEELLERYWDIAYSEGKTGQSHGNEANKVLFELRALLHQAQPQEIKQEK